MNTATARQLDERLVELEWHRSYDVAARLDRARALERDAHEHGDELTAQRARLVAADMSQRLGDVALGARQVVAVLRWASEHGSARLVARSHLVLSSIFESIGDAPATLDHAVRAIDLLDDEVPARERGNHLLRLADALAVNESADQSRQRYREAETVFAALNDRERLLIVLNNVAVLESELGSPAEAIAAANRLEEAIGAGETNSDFAETIARARLVGGDVPGARRAAEHGLELLASDGSPKANAPAELSLTLAEVLLAAGDLPAAHAELERCVQVCEERHLAGLLAQAMNVQSQLFAAQGDFERAYLAHREYHAATVRLRSQQQDAAARAREALFETTEARRDAERFRLQARVDPLTELYNRRFVDETLPDWLAGQALGGSVVVAIIDLDHFKRINDDLTHAVGDDVLRQIADLLTAHTTPDCFAARIGGEEFLLVERGVDAADSIERVDLVRRTVEAFDWSALAPGLHVTISAGVAVAGADDTQRTLLSRADRCLYDAKEGGRNRVVADA